MIKRYEIRPRRKRTMNGNGGEPIPGTVPAAPPQRPTPVVDPLTPAGVFEDK
jgi:hypothetical protein